MKKIFINLSLVRIIILFLITIAIYSYSVFCIPEGNLHTFLSGLSSSFIEGFFLALAVFFVSIFLEEKRKERVRKNEQTKKIKTLINLLKNTFRRAKSNWNFSNRSSTFYFDNNWINPLYDLLTRKDRDWEIFFQEYKESADGKNDLVNELSSFIYEMDLALINTETLDKKLESIKLGPELAASMRSGFISDRNGAQNRAEFCFWVYRATWAGANTTEITFGIPLFMNQQIREERIEGLYNEAITLGETKEFKETIGKLNSSKTKLNKKIVKIKKIIASV